MKTIILQPQTAISQPPSVQKRCDGCPHISYSAPFGQEWNKEPHSRCYLFGTIPMIVDDKHNWITSEIPLECPTHYPAQRSLFQ